MEYNFSRISKINQGIVYSIKTTILYSHSKKNSDCLKEEWKLILVQIWESK